MCSSPKNVITPPHPPHPPPPTPQPTPRQKKQQKKDKKRGFTEAKHSKKEKNALSLWRQCSEHAKTLFTTYLCLSVLMDIYHKFCNKYVIHPETVPAAATLFEVQIDFSDGPYGSMMFHVPSGYD